MSASVSMTIQVDAKTAEVLDRLVSVTEHDRAWHLHRAVEAYLCEHAEDYEEIRRAVTEAEAGDFATDEEMAETFALFSRGLKAS